MPSMISPPWSNLAPCATASSTCSLTFLTAFALMSGPCVVSASTWKVQRQHSAVGRSKSLSRTDSGSYFESPDFLDEELGELVEYTAVYQNTVRRDADLPRASELDGDCGLDSCLKRNITENNANWEHDSQPLLSQCEGNLAMTWSRSGYSQWSVSSELERTLLEGRGRVGGQEPPDTR